jgi:hypothetical protein
LIPRLAQYKVIIWLDGTRAAASPYFVEHVLEVMTCYAIPIMTLDHDFRYFVEKVFSSLKSERATSIAIHQLFGTVSRNHFKMLTLNISTTFNLASGRNCWLMWLCRTAKN